MTTYRLVREHAAVEPPVLDADQQRVVDHASSGGGGPLLVLAGPGTGKTTTLVEAIVRRIEEGTDADQVLALTFSRKAAQQLRDRVTARLGRTLSTPIAATFHSYAFSLLRAFTPSELYVAPLRLLTAPEADVLVRELLELNRDDLQWPPGLAEAARTRGFAQEVAAVIARAREKGVDHEQLIELGRSDSIPEFVVAGQFLDVYLRSMDDLGATDYADLLRRAVIEARAHQAQLRQQVSCVFVDEYQDTDPGQVALLRALAGGGRDLVVVGDPHQSIYGFRGADVRGILDFPREFPRADGEPAPTVVLRRTRRFGGEILAASQRVAAGLSLVGSIAPADREAFARPEAVGGCGPGRVEVHTFDSDRAEIEHVADLLRRAHLEDGVPWSDMAVLSRSGRATLPVLRRMLGSAGVPVEVAPDEIPLVAEPAVRPLLDALATVADLPEPPDPAVAESLLLSRLGGLDATQLRGLGRDLRRRDQELARAEKRQVGSSTSLVARALVQPALLEPLSSRAAARASRLAGLLAGARESLARIASVEEVLWLLWSGSDWGDRLRDAVDRGGAAARRAHRDLDAVCALFDQAARAEDLRGFTSVRTFIDSVRAQQIPADSLAERGVRGGAVRLLTAHRAKGLEWPLVVVAHVQESGWPDLRRRSSLLGGDRIGIDRYGHIVDLPAPTRRELLAEERRLFYVACTRARERLVVTAVDSTQEEGEEPSRFLTELLGEEPVRVPGRPARALTLAGVVAELRRTTVDPASSPALRRAAARRLAALAAERVGERPLAPAADPDRWWGTHVRTLAETSVRPTDQPVRLSASAVTSLQDCPARWFLEREAGGASYAGTAAGFGNLVHKIAEHVGSNRLTDPDIDELMRVVDAVWDTLPFRTPWSRTKEREAARAAIERFLVAHRGSDRTVLGTEVGFDLEIDLPDEQRIRLRGSADRVEMDADGRLVVVDLKTGKYAPTEQEIRDHPQLGLYQLVVERGALDTLLPDGGPGRSAGAELWQLRLGGAAPKVQRQAVQQPDEEGWTLAERQAAEAARTILSEDFPATPGDKICRTCEFRALCPAHTTAAVIE